MGKSYLHLQDSEGYILAAASRLYSAYLTTSYYTGDNEAALMRKAIQEALQMAHAIDAAVIAENEVE
ncbi:MAG: hypothetical protein CMJ76_10355 [Planctomycetaceae bacterium]|nr:hypothetical protein [Planctomycetaceae bacterium]|tara:strand:+ start:1151 stop:1351 length:201 start_codon:yes stop_codon:yes gene_type:complete